MKKLISFVLGLLILLTSTVSIADTYSLVIMESDLLQTENLDYPVERASIKEIPQFTSTPLLPTTPAYTMMILKNVLDHNGDVAPVTENLLAAIQSDNDFWTVYEQIDVYSMTYQAIVDIAGEELAEKYGPYILLFFTTGMEYTIFDTEIGEDTCSVMVALYDEGVPMSDRLFRVHMKPNEFFASNTELLSDEDNYYPEQHWGGETAYYWIDSVEITEHPIPTTANDYIGSWECVYAIENGYKELIYISAQAIRKAGISFHFLLDINEDFTYSIKYNDLRNIVATNGCWNWIGGAINLDSNEQLYIRKDGEMLLLSLGDFTYHFCQVLESGSDTVTNGEEQSSHQSNTYHIEEMVSFATQVRQQWISLSSDGHYALAIAECNDGNCVLIHDMKTGLRLPILLDETDRSQRIISNSVFRPESAQNFQVAWSPNGKYAVLTYRHSGVNTYFAPCLVDVEQLTITTLSMPIEESDNPCVTQASFSPDGKMIYYTCYPSDASKSIVCAYDISSDKTQVLYSGKQEIDGTEYYITGTTMACLSDNALLHIVHDRKSTYLGLATLNNGVWEHTILPIDENGSVVVANQLSYNQESGYGIIDALIATDGSHAAQKGAEYIFSIKPDGSDYFSYNFQKMGHEFFKILQSPSGNTFICLGVNVSQPAHYQFTIQDGKISEKPFYLPLDTINNRIVLQPGHPMNKNCFSACGLWSEEYLMLGCEGGVSLFRIMPD